MSHLLAHFASSGSSRRQYQDGPDDHDLVVTQNGTEEPCCIGLAGLWGDPPVYAD
jgi:hypothetical protein